MSGKPFVQDYFCRGLRVIFVVSAGDSFCKFGKMIYYYQKTGVARVGLAEFQMIELNQVVEIATINALQGVARISRWVFCLLASQALLDVIYYVPLDSRPSVPFLYSGQHFAYPLMSSCALYRISCWKSCGMIIMHGRTCRARCWGT